MSLNFAGMKKILVEEEGQKSSVTAFHIHQNQI